MAAYHDHDNNNSDAELEEEVLILVILLRRWRRRLQAYKRTVWAKQWILRRSEQGAYANLVRELGVEDLEKFRQFRRLEREHFEEILSR